MANFYPRPPRGGRLNPSLCHSAQVYFYPRPPRGGRRFLASRSSAGETISIHALREEGDQSRFAPRKNAAEFLSTPSARRATWRLLWHNLSMTISIHALREEGDYNDVLVESAANISIHALREEGDEELMIEDAAKVEFLSTPSARRATGIRLGYKATVKFLSTPSARRATRVSSSQCKP